MFQSKFIDILFLVPNSKKSCEWDFEETAAEKILTKSLSLTDRLKFEFGLDAQEGEGIQIFPVYIKFKKYF